jgi:hypothetical protein
MQHTGCFKKRKNNAHTYVIIYLDVLLEKPSMPRKEWKQLYTLCLGLDHSSTSAIHCSSVILLTGDVVLTSFAGTPSK